MPAPKPVEPAPVLGDPLPGDLGRPVLRAEREAGLHAHGGPDAAEAERLARLKEAEDAARAPLFYKASGRGAAPAAPGGSAAGGFAPSMLAGAAPAPAVDPMQTQNTQENKPKP